MTPGFSILPEPELEFRHGQRLVDPHAGLALFGPYDAGVPSQPRSIAYGVIGTAEGAAAFDAFGRRLSDPIVSQPYGDPEGDRKPHLLWPPFPGFDAGFHSVWPAASAWSRLLDRDKVLAAATKKDKWLRAYEVVNFYWEAIRAAAEREESFHVLVCVIPDEVWQNCRPLSSVVGSTGHTLSAAGRKLRQRQPDLFGLYNPDAYDFSVDFRRQLKARAMEFDIPLQLVRESTLRLEDTGASSERNLTVLSDRAWNLSTTLYYKAGGKPWRLSTAREGVSYVGLAFRRSELDVDLRTACCAAQMFLDSGDGVVFRGEFGPWYSPKDNQYHLSAGAAENLLRGVLETYRDREGRSLREVFLHSRSTISREEFAGYRRARPEGVKLVGIRVRQDVDGMRLYRPGKWPVLRGTLWVLNHRTAYLWAAGFKPSVLSYDGWEVPVPLRIDIEHGEADIVEVARDVFGLTKLNYNTCKLGDASPVTVGFSDAVGEILVANPTVKARRPAFKFYI